MSAVCGICGLVSRDRERRFLEQTALEMNVKLGHRGPDASGVWAGDGVALGHTRLSILDLSPAGAQPMRSVGGRWVVSFNGEIFNHLDIRDQLVGVAFRGHSDTETLVAAFEAFGFERTLPLLVGMFAIAAWDSQSKKLYLARDRAGQKPLFYGFHAGQWAFGSELGALEALPGRPALDRQSMALMLRYNAIPAPRTIYEGIRKLPPASFLCFDVDRWEMPEPRLYWGPSVSTCPLPADAVKARAASLLEDSVKLRMLSDVPLGAFLSGGIDSSLVVGVMQKLSSRPVQTFTMDFEDLRFSEAAQARAVAHHLGTQHTELKVTAVEARELVPALGALCDEPFGDSSLVPTLMLSQLTRRSVTVALTGDGGDELFGGYHRQIWLPRIAAAMRLLPAVLRRRVGDLLLGPSSRAGLLRLIAALRLPLRMPDEKLDKLGYLFRDGGDLGALYRSSLSHARDPQALFQQAVSDAVDEMAGVPRGLSAFDTVCRADFSFYMPNDVLVKVDRASMRYGLEARSPFLDHRLVEFAFSLDRGHKVRGAGGKQLLKDMLSDFLPPALLNQPKMGFAVPIGGWLRTELRGWVEGLLSSGWLDDGQLLSRDAVSAVWSDHLSGRDRHNELWNILMLLAWLEARR
jgi:asparagine synthase (glutamine-hydrolysing)